MLWSSKWLRGQLNKGEIGMLRSDDGQPGESLGETSTEELEQTRADIQARLKKKPGDPHLTARLKAISGELGNRTGPDFGKGLPSEEADVSPAKARQILRDGTVHGKPLTEAQRGMFGAIAGQGRTKKSEAENWLEKAAGGLPAKPGAKVPKPEPDPEALEEERRLAREAKKAEKAKKALGSSEAAATSFAFSETEHLSDLDDWIEKAEGARGGNVIGRTKTGKPIYASGGKHGYGSKNIYAMSHHDWSAKDHRQAAEAHGKKGNRSHSALHSARAEHMEAEKRGDSKAAQKYKERFHGALSEVTKKGSGVPGSAMKGSGVPGGAVKGSGVPGGAVKSEVQMNAIGDWLEKATGGLPTATTDVHASGDLKSKKKKKKKKPNKDLPKGAPGGFGDEEGGNLEETAAAGTSSGPPTKTKTSTTGKSETLSVGSPEGGPLAKKSEYSEGYAGATLYAVSGHDNGDAQRGLAAFGGPDVILKAGVPAPEQTIEKSEVDGKCWTHGDTPMLYSDIEDAEIAKASGGGLHVPQPATLDMAGRPGAIREMEICKSCLNPKPQILASCPGCGASALAEFNSQPGLIVTEDLAKSVYPTVELDITIPE